MKVPVLKVEAVGRHAWQKPAALKLYISLRPSDGSLLQAHFWMLYGGNSRNCFEVWQGSRFRIAILDSDRVGVASKERGNG
jgi:hypothetical protein